MTGPAEIAHGPMLIGLAINVLLLGIMATQVYLYYTHYKEDRVWIKTYVAILFVLNITNSVLCLVYIYDAVIIHFGDPEFLTRVPWLFGVADPMLTGMITCVVQIFFAWRIFILTKRWIYLVLIIIPALMGGVASFVTPFIVDRHPFFVDMQLAAVPDTMWLGAGIVADILITSILVFYLNHKTGIKRSDLVVDRIIRFTVQTGLLTVIVAVIDIIFFLTNTNGVHVMLTFTLSKLYSTSLMSSLNSRRTWDQGSSHRGPSVGDFADNGVVVGSFMSRPGQLSSLNRGKVTDSIQYPSSGQFGVFVEVESHQLRDIGEHDEYASSKGTSGNKETKSIV